MQLNIEEFEKIEKNLKEFPFKSSVWPTPEECKNFLEANHKCLYSYINWILLTSPTPITDEEKQSKKILIDFFHTNVGLYDPTDTF